LITGSSGLIGLTISSLLREDGYEVVSMDIRGNPSNGNTPLFGDVLDNTELSQAMKDVQGVIHLAGVSRVIDAQRNPERCLCVNVGGIKGLIETVRKQPQPPWIIYASSREVYGEHLPVKEEHPLKPINVYGESKKTAETLLRKAVASGVTSIIFRFSNVYGSVYDHSNRVIPAFLMGVINGTPLTVESPNHTFDFTYVKDVGEGLLAAVKKLSSKEFGGTDVYNFCTGQGTSLEELLGLIQKITGREIITLVGEPRNYDVVRYVGDPSKLKSQMGYRCETNLRLGLELTYNDYLNSRSL
jgi:nucleoside-diphosphate-sugar epimerase